MPSPIPAPPATPIPTPTLRAALNATPHRTLVGIARVHGLPGHNRTPKATLVERLDAHLDEPARIRAVVAALPHAGQHAMALLARSGGVLPADEFVLHFGALPRYRPWLPDATRAPWREPVSIAERLRFLGLVYLLKQPDHSKPPDPSCTTGQSHRPNHRQPLRRQSTRTWVVLPVEIAAALQPARAGHTVMVGDPTLTAEPQPPCDIALDLAHLLAYLTQHEVRTRHQRWLGLDDLRAIGERLEPPEPIGVARSELQTTRLRFIHYLAETLGLIDCAAGWLSPSPGALAWLDLPPAERLRGAWSAWLDPAEANRQRWGRYRLPGSTLRDPQAAARVLLATISEHGASEHGAAQSWYPLTDLTGAAEVALHPLLPWWQDEPGKIEAWTAAFLLGPLRSLGAVAVNDATGRLLATGNASARELATRELAVGESVAGGLYRLTPRGAWLLDRPGSHPPPIDQRPLARSVEGAIATPPSSRPAGILALAGYTAWDGTDRVYRLSRETVIPALARRPVTADALAQDLMAMLTRYTVPTPGDTERREIAGWLSEAPVARLSTRTLLELPDPKILDHLLADPKLRRHIARVLGPDAVVLQADDLAAVVRRIARHGLIIQVAADPNHRNAPSGAEPPKSESPSHSAAGSHAAAGQSHAGSHAAATAGPSAWLATALLVLEHLAERLAITAPPPPAAREWLLGQLDPAAWTAAESAADSAIRRLHEALDGPSPQPPLIPQDAALAVAESAIDDAADLWLRYWSAWRGEITERRVTPEWMEWLGDQATLVGQCHLRAAERRFRLDRVVDMRRVEPVGAG